MVYRHLSISDKQMSWEKGRGVCKKVVEDNGDGMLSDDTRRVERTLGPCVVKRVVGYSLGGEDVVKH
jgi:two-component sensor histidine kinase